MARTKVQKSFRDRMEVVISSISSDTIRVGFSHIDLWLNMGNFAMNRIMSGRFDRGLLFGRNYVLYGVSGSGKSLQAAICAADAQHRHGALVVWIDVEHATDDDAGKEWLVRAGLDMDNLIYTSMIQLEDIKKAVSLMAKDYRTAVEAGEDVQPIVFVIDSWAAAQTKSAYEHTVKGELVGDQGQKAKQTGETILSLTHLCAGLPIMCLGIQHVMDNQDGYGRKYKTTGGNKQIYYASGCLLFTQKELREEDVAKAETSDGKKVAALYKMSNEQMSAELKKKYKNRTVGITVIVENLKSRVSKPYERIEVQVPFTSGLDPYSGLFDLMAQEGVIRNPSVGWYAYTDGDKEIKFQRTNFMEHADRLMELAQSDVSDTTIITTEEIVHADA